MPKQGAKSTRHNRFAALDRVRVSKDEKCGSNCTIRSGRPKREPLNGAALLIADNAPEVNAATGALTRRPRESAVFRNALQRA
jgi:hypothetical protein